MKRDMDIVRRILFAVEETNGVDLREIKVEKIDESIVGYHLVIMIEAGLIEGSYQSIDGYGCPHVLVSRLTWKGHDFLDACRDETRWKGAKDIISKVSGVTFDVLKNVLTEIMTKQVSGMIT